MVFNDRTYDILKKLVMNWLPASGTLYWALSAIWHWPYAEQVVGTISAVCTFLGVLIGISAENYRELHNEN